MLKFDFSVLEKLMHFIKHYFKYFSSIVFGFVGLILSKTKAVANAVKTNLPTVKKTIISFLKTADSMKTKIIAVVLATVCCLTITMIAYAVEYKTAVQVSYNGRSFGFVSDMKKAQYIAETVNKSVHGALSYDFKLQNATVAENLILESDKIIEGIYENSDDIHLVSALYVDGILSAVANDFDALQSELNKGIKHYTTDGFEFKGFSADVILRDIYVTWEYFEKHLLESDKLLNGDYGFGFVTSRIEEYEEAIPFNEVTKEDGDKYTNYKKVTQKGKDGLRSVKATVNYVNGVRDSADELESAVITEAVDKVTVVGTKEKPVYHKGYVLATSIMTNEQSEMVFPVDCNGSTYISSFWGDGRGHKGIDIAAPRGTEVYAAANGKVSYVGYRSDYGYLIILDHADGKTQTYYSHNRKNLVKVGDEVTAGQLIATVGASGNATGNHLHFAVVINGKMVDPARFVGLK